jgi:hypothetical protein
VSNGWEMSHTGGDGDNPSLFYKLAYPRPHLVAGFRPSASGFHFANRWPGGTTMTTLGLGIINLPLGEPARGLCGGMVHAALDYWHAGMPIPSPTVAPTDPGDPLFDYLFTRLVDSFDLPVLPQILMNLMDPALPDSDEHQLNPVGLAHGRAWVMVKQELPAIRASIDAGRPCPVCLVKVKSAWPLDLQQNHQVLAYGYTLDGTTMTLNLYDPNQPDADDVTLSLDISRTDRPITVFTPVARALGSIYCFLHTPYTAKTPPYVSGSKAVYVAMPTGASGNNWGTTI